MFFVASCRAWPWSESGPHPAANAISTSTTSAPKYLTMLTLLMRASSSLSPLGCRIFLGSRISIPTSPVRVRSIAVVLENASIGSLGW